MQLTSLSLALTRAGFLTFSPSSLFTAGEQGVWYDPSDFSTMFQDAAGTTPVTAVEQPVGLMLDKSKGLVLGSELVTNGDFSGVSLAGFTPRGGTSVLTITGGQLVCTGANAGVIAVIPTVVGKTYKIVGSIVAASANVYIDKSDNESTFTNRVQIVTNVAAPQVAKQGVFTATATTSYIWFWVNDGTAGSSITIDNISVRELPGNHAFQTTSTSRPVLSARYNLLTKTEQINDSAWVKGSGVTTPTVDTVTVTTADTGVHQASSNPAATYTIQAEFKFVDADLVCFGLVNVANTLFYRFSTNAFSGPAAGAATATLLEDGWVRVRYTYTVGAAGTFGPIVKPQSIGSVRVRNLDFRVTNDAAGQPAYQRVNTATDYDTTGFKPYLRFDGTDDWLQTNSVNFTGTDKMTVFAGVRKLSDAASGVVAELSATSATNNGSFGLFAPAGAATNFSFQSRGSITVGATATPFAAPITTVVTGIGDISGDSVILRVNGAQAASDTADQGAGNYGNYPLYIGRRGGTTLPFNGRLYGLVVRGAASTAVQIQQTEAWLNQRTGAF